MTKAVFFDIDDTIYDYIGAHNNTMPVMKEWAYENLGIAKRRLGEICCRGKGEGR